MDPRYQDQQVANLWSKEWTYDTWWGIEQAVVRAQIEQLGPEDESRKEQMQILVSRPGADFEDPWNTTGIDAYEQKMGHDVAAFVAFMRDWYGEPYGRWLHYGLTSSDLVDTAQALRFKALEPTLTTLLDGLNEALVFWVGSKQMVVGRTHGEPAEPLSMGMRAMHWYRLVGSAVESLSDRVADMWQVKTSGPVGNFAHNDQKIEARVAIELGLMSCGPGASQIIPRIHLAQWASAAAQVVHACAKIAMDVRMMLVLDEASEIRPIGQVGSSSMAHKTNPIRAEQITGMQRLAAAYASALQPMDMWLERDISNSCVERVAVPDLWHVLLHVIRSTTALLKSLDPGYKADSALHREEGKLLVHRETLESIGPMDANEAREHAVAWCSTHPLETGRKRMDPTWYARNWAYPEAT